MTDITTEHKSVWTWLFNPFIFIAGGRSLLLGIASILAAGIIGSFSNSHFNGVLDLHSGRATLFWIYISEGLVAWLVLANVLFAFGKITSKTSFRMLDLFGTQAMARWPTLISVLVLWPKPVRSASERFGKFILSSLVSSTKPAQLATSDVVIFILTTLVAILMTIWFIVLAYRSYSISCNIKGGKAIGTFIAGLLIAEILSIILMPIIFESIQKLFST
jgi:hypothetical protein